MASLTEISISARKFFLWLILVFIGYLIVRILFTLGVSYWKATHPIPPAPPDVRFGKIPSPQFTDVSLTTSGLIFKLENIEGRPPETTMSAKVYRMPKKLPSLLSSQKAKIFAAKLGFTSEPNQLSSTEYQFIDQENNDRTLTLDTITMNFHLKYDYDKNPQIFTKGRVTSDDQAINEAKNFIQYNNLFDESISKGIIKPERLRYNQETKEFMPASSLSNTQAVRINYFRKALDELEVKPPKFWQSYNYVLYVPGSSAGKQIVEVSYKFWPIAFDDFATYPLRNSGLAWQDLLDGYGLVISMGNNQSDNIVIRKIYLAYYDSEEPQDYLQPIYVFEGDNNFVAFLPAIDPNWLE